MGRGAAAKNRLDGACSLCVFHHCVWYQCAFYRCVFLLLCMFSMFNFILQHLMIAPAVAPKTGAEKSQACQAESNVGGHAEPHEPDVPAGCAGAERQVFERGARSSGQEPKPENLRSRAAAVLFQRIVCRCGAIRKYGLRWLVCGARYAMCR